MLKQTIIFEGAEHEVYDCVPLQVFCGRAPDISNAYHQPRLSFATTDKDWFDSLIQGKTYSMTFQGWSGQWHLGAKIEEKELQLDFRLTEPDNSKMS